MQPGLGGRVELFLSISTGPRPSGSVKLCSGGSKDPRLDSRVKCQSIPVSAQVLGWVGLWSCSDSGTRLCLGSSICLGGCH